MNCKNWNQPCCDRCWVKEHPDRRPFRLESPQYEICAWCGVFTRSGIFVRADPKTVPYPAP